MVNNIKEVVTSFVAFVSNELKLNIPYKIQLSTDRKGKFSTYAYYDPQNGEVHVYIKNRGTADILRSIAHELIHAMQNQKGELKGEIPDVGGKIEDEANAVAGQLIKKFGKETSYPIYDL